MSFFVSFSGKLSKPIAYWCRPGYVVGEPRRDQKQKFIFVSRLALKRRVANLKLHVDDQSQMAADIGD